MTTSITSDAHWPGHGENADGVETDISAPAKPGDRRITPSGVLGIVGDAALLLLVVLLFPLLVLLVGTPVALFVRLLAEIAQRF